MKKLNIKIDKDKLKDGAKAVGLAMATIVAAVAKNSLESALQVKANEFVYKKATYTGVVNTVISSDMWSSDKEKVIAIIPTNADEELYGSIMAVLMGDDWSSDKIKMIKMLCNKVAIPTTAKIETIEKEETENE